MYSPIVILSIYLSAIFSPEMIVLFCFFLIAIVFSLMVLRKIKFKDIFRQHVSRGIQASVFVVGSTAAAVVLVQTLKHIFAVPRPEYMLVAETGYRFPSGHAAVSTALLIAVIVCTHTLYKTWITGLKYFITAWAIILLIGVCISRLVLKVHKPIDILVGMLVGLISVGVMFYIYKQLSHDSTTQNKNLG